MRSSLLTGGRILLLTVLPAAAGYPDETGYTQLKAELGAAMPTGIGVDMTQVEGGPADAYMPQAGSGTFAGTGFWAGKMFTAKSGASAASDHAYRVAQYMYGDNTSFPDSNSSMSPGVVNVDCYSADSWDDEFLAPLPLRLVPAVENRAVQNHSWIFDADPAIPGRDPIRINDLLRRQDFSINRDVYVCCVGMNNGPASACPDLFAAAYNVISVGLTNGLHSRGGTTSDMDGPGRRKPEIVAPANPTLAATSFSTGYLSSAAGLLSEAATTANGRHTKTIKAILLAGATKEEFPAWAKSATDPIDAIYGAGELNIYNSYYILNGGEQPANNAAGRPFLGWDFHSLLAGGTADYRLNIPAGMYGVELSAFIVWHRTPTDPLGGGFALRNDPLINFDLTLFHDPAAGGDAVTMDSSTSTIYNIEHVWKKNLPAGNYRLRASRGSTSGTTHDFAIAWRLTTAPHQPVPQIATAGNSVTFTFSGLLPGQPYKFQSSPDMVNWTDIESFTASVPLETRVAVKPIVPRLLYRLLPVLP